MIVSSRHLHFDSRRTVGGLLSHISRRRTAGAQRVWLRLMCEAVASLDAGQVPSRRSQFCDWCSGYYWSWRSDSAIMPRQARGENPVPATAAGRARPAPADGAPPRTSPWPLTSPSPATAHLSLPIAGRRQSVRRTDGEAIPPRQPESPGGVDHSAASPMIGFGHSLCGRLGRGCWLPATAWVRSCWLGVVTAPDVSGRPRRAPSRQQAISVSG